MYLLYLCDLRSSKVSDLRVQVLIQQNVLTQESFQVPVSRAWDSHIQIK